jgi:hypothetical protein
MLKPTDTQVRELALELLASVRRWPHQDKEALFARGMRFYRWALTYTREASDLDVYTEEFALHHGLLLQKSHHAIKDAAFITWFVENRFHHLPLFVFDAKEETKMVPQTCFSSPVFILPTESPEQSYLIQWLFWHLSLMPVEPADFEDEIYCAYYEQPLASATVERWAYGLARCLPASCKLDRPLLVYSALRFFTWCHAHVCRWDALSPYMQKFAFPMNALNAELDEHNVYDAMFIIWFIKQGFDQQGMLEQEKAS